MGYLKVHFLIFFNCWIVSGWFPNGFRMVTYPLGIYLVNFGIFKVHFLIDVSARLLLTYSRVFGWFPHILQIKMLSILFPWIINYLCTLLLTYFFILHNWTNVWLRIRRKTKNTSSIRNPTCCITILLGGSIPSCENLHYGHVWWNLSILVGTCYPNVFEVII